MATASGFDELLDGFELSLRARRRSPKTITAYTDTARRFQVFCAARGADPVHAKRGDVEAFIADQLDRHTASTAATRYRCLQQWFVWLVDDGELDATPMVRMSPPSLDEKVVPVLGADAIAALFKTCASDRLEDLRDLALMRFLLDTGTRLGEMVGLAVADVDVKAGAAVVTGKGNRSRRVYFTPDTAAAIARYRRRCRDTHPAAGTGALWLGSRGPLRDNGVAQMLNRRGRAAGLGRVHAHQFRHTWAHTMKSAGMADDETMALAGWRSPQMLARYGRSALSERAEAAYRRITEAKRA